LSVRYGAVSYLNARPLIEGLEPLVLDTPARLVERFDRGEVDVALLPVAAGEASGIARVGSLGVAAEGAVDSVLLFLRTKAEAVESLFLDPASRTSRILAEIILREQYGRAPRIVDSPEADAELVIGDRALLRAREGEPHLDLGEEWSRWTDLPFVFAAWYGASDAEAALEEAFARGSERIAAFAAAGELDASYLETYLRERIRYRIGPREEEGLSRFLYAARRLGLL
jgi:chorismate dehydratase